MKMKKKRKTRAVGVRIAETVLERVEIAAALEGESRSRFCAEAAAERADRRLEEIRTRGRRGGNSDQAA